MSRQIRDRYQSPRSPLDMGTPAQREAYWQLLVGTDAYDLGKENGAMDFDPEGACLCEDDDPDAREANMPDPFIVDRYHDGWIVGRAQARDAGDTQASVGEHSASA